jgi:CheY-like chemotaxis protein
MTHADIDILILDDNEDIVTMLQAMFEMKGYKVKAISSPGELIECIGEYKPNVLLMDMLLSGGDGRELCTQIRNNPSHGDLKVMMMSAHPNAAQDCYAAGADIFISKPFDMGQMLSALAHALK